MLKIIRQEKGIALIMIMTSITFMTAILADFTYETQINKIKVTNVQNKLQARLNAESGLKFALTRLKLYKEARNLLRKNKNAKDLLKDGELNQIWSIPFVYPIPIAKNANAIQKSALEDFEENSLIQGGMKVFIKNSSNLINVNLLRISKFNKPKATPTPNPNGNENESGGANSPIFEVEKKLTELLKSSMEAKSESDDVFAANYGDIEPEFMVKIIKFYVSDKNSYEEPEEAEISALFAETEIAPKHAPLTSTSELYLLPKWDDTLIDLIINEITVHGDAAIDVNKITDKTLSLIFPTLTKEQRAEFFKYRDDPKDKHYFTEMNEFRRFIVSNSNFLSGPQYDERINEFKKAGIRFGTAARLFKVTSTGEYNRAKTTLNAVINLPAKPVPTPTPTPTPVPPEPGATPTPPPQPTPTPTPGEPELLDPVVVEILMH